MALFYEVIQVALGLRNKLSRTPLDSEWSEMFVMAQKQAISGLAFIAIEALSRQGQVPPKNIILEWIGLYEAIRHQNLIVNQRLVDISSLFAKEGLKICLLKGQGNALMYSDPLSRQSGDIDIWVDATKECVCRLVSKYVGDIDTDTSIHHIEFPIFDDVEVEIHHIPTYSIVRRKQKALEKYVEDSKLRQFDNKVNIFNSAILINIPTVDFNIIYQLSHMQRHFFNGGIGLRHLIDFYFLLKKAYNHVSLDMIELQLKNLGLFRFTRAIMWLLKETIGIDEKYLIIAPEEKSGLLLKDEIEKGGNFGKYDQRWSKKIKERSTTLSIIARNLKMMWLFPEEALSVPINGVMQRFFAK